MIGILAQSIAIPTIFSIIALAVGKKLREKTGWIALIPLAYSTAVLAYVNLLILSGRRAVEESYYWSPLIGRVTLLADGLSAPIALTIALLSAAVCIYSIEYMKEERTLELYFALYLLYAAGMLGTVLSTNLAAFFLFFEMMLIPSWALIGIWGTGLRELIAYKYFMFTEAGALCLLAGIASAYSISGTLDIMELAEKTAGVDTAILLAIAIAMLIGLFVKMAIVPLHSWLPDAHAEAPTPISALLSPAMIGIGGYATIRILYTAFPRVLQVWEFDTALSILALITMVYGGFMALAQTDIKRLLAYSSISQMGYMLFGASSLSPLGILGAVLLYVSHGLAKAVLFMVSGVFMHEFETRNIEELRGLASVMPFVAVASLVAFLCLAGVPPMLGFWAEILVFAGSIHTALAGSIDTVRLSVTVLAIIASIITAGYGLWTVKRVFYGEPVERAREAKRLSLLMAIPIAVLVVLAVVLGVYPTPLTKIVAAAGTTIP